MDFSSCYWCCKTLSINILTLTNLLLNYYQICKARNALYSDLRSFTGDLFRLDVIVFHQAKPEMITPEPERSLGDARCHAKLAAARSTNLLGQFENSHLGAASSDPPASLDPQAVRFPAPL